jgi:hypothetical protein
MDQSKKTMRHFYCRDLLWETFEQMANDFDCSIDYLVNESMRAYAKAKNYALPSSSSSQLPPQVVNQAMGDGNHFDTRPDGPPDRRAVERAEQRLEQRPTPRPPAATTPPAARASSPPPPPSGSAPPPPPVSARPSVPPVAAVTPTPSPISRPASSPSGPRATPEPAPAPVTLYLLFNNQRIPIDKDQFIIGRGSKTSDLPIKDGNISRRHAAVIRRNGTFYIKDLGSTNGIDYKGMRIDNKRIDEGDVFNLCDYELRFTYR